MLSAPPAPLISSFSMPVKLTMRPAPATKASVTMKLSPTAVPMITTVSTPGPPEMLTGAFCR